MSRPIQSLAPGFLGALGLKNEGKLPPDLLDAVQPQIDLFPFYALGVRETFSVSAGLNVKPPAVSYVFPELTVPAGQVWYVHGFIAQVSLAAAATWSGVACHFSSGITTAVRASQLFGGGNAGAVTVFDGWLGGFLAAPGDQFGVLTSDGSGAGVVNGFGSVTISRFTA